MTDSALWQLCLHIALLSGTAIGGGMIAVMPDMHRFVVDTHHWMTSEQFAEAFAMAQASPGPNFLYVSLIGWKVAGWTERSPRARRWFCRPPWSVTRSCASARAARACACSRPSVPG